MNNFVNYATEINERISIYKNGLSQCQAYLVKQQFDKATLCGLKTILESCNSIAPETNDLGQLTKYCERAVDGFPKNFTIMPLQEAVLIIEGILTERLAFYRQLENLTH